MNSTQLPHYRAIVKLHRRPSRRVWTLLNQHNGVPSYRLTPAAAFGLASAYLQHWIDTGLPPAEAWSRAADAGPEVWATE